MNKAIRAFWDCGDNQIIEYAILRARLNTREKRVLCLIYDECMTQEEVAEALDLSTRTIQGTCATAYRKLLSIPWVVAYAKELMTTQQSDIM